MGINDFSTQDLERYARHICLDGLGKSGQLKICNAKVLVIGVGGLGSVVTMYLAAAGIGTLGIADADIVDLSNLQRQIIHHTDDIGVSKVVSASYKLKSINPNVQINSYDFFLNVSNIRKIIGKYDFVVDATDNFASKFLINDSCVLENKPFSHGGVLNFNGQTMTVIPGKTACYRCVFGEAPPEETEPTLMQKGILGATVGVLGSIQATEVLKYITGLGQCLTDRLQICDMLNMKFKTLKVKINNQCNCS